MVNHCNYKTCLFFFILERRAAERVWMWIILFIEYRERERSNPTIFIFITGVEIENEIDFGAR